MKKKLINHKTRLKIWRGVRRDMKFGVEHPESGKVVGLCHSLIRELYKCTDYGKDTMLASDFFPEMLRFKPIYVRPGQGWWAFDKFGYEKRVEVCDKIIKKLENKK